MYSSWLSIILLSLNAINLINAACVISTNQDITNPQVLILRPEGGTGHDAFFIPNVGDNINVENGQVIHLNCGGRNFRINNVNVGVQSANAVCTTGNQFNVLGNNVQFSDISCSLYPIHTARYTGSSCLGTYRQFEIGYEVNSNFINLMTGCFDESLQTTAYSLLELLPNTDAARQVNFPRPGWTEGNFYNLGGIALDTLYTRNMQRSTINNLLGLAADSTQYIHGTNNFYLARGHLSANADFIFGTQQRSTFYFVNVAPQWQVVNQANWGTLEANIRRYIANTTRRLLVYTGSYGVSTLPHAETGINTELYLFVDQNNNKAIPVPQLFWKVVYEPISRTGVALLTVNNPFITNVTPHIICPDVCNQISWLTWSPTDITRGYSYCCTVSSFRSATGIIPDFEVVDLLK